MRTGNWAECQYENRENGTRWKGIAEERQRPAAAGELCGHDAGTNDAGEQKSCAQTLGDTTLRQRGLHVGSATFPVAPSMRPISLSFFCRLSWSSERSGNAVKIPIR